MAKQGRDPGETAVKRGPASADIGFPGEPRLRRLGDWDHR